MHPLAAPGALWVLSRAGKVPRPPAGGRNLSQGTHSLWKAGERAFLAFPVLQGFAPAGATRGLSDHPLDPFGAHPYIRGRNLSQGTRSLWRAGEKSFTFFFCFLGDFASAEATKGLSDRPLETFGAHPAEADGDRKKIDFLRRQGKEPLLSFPVSQELSPLRRRPKGFPVALWKPSGPTLVKRMGITKIDFMRKARERTFTFFFLFLRSFRLCGGDQRAFRSPFGNLRGPSC